MTENNFLTTALLLQNKLSDDINGSFTYGDNIRKAFLDQRNIPNEVSKSDLGFLNNAFAIDDRRQNYTTDLDISRNQALIDQSNTRYNLRNVGRTQELEDLAANIARGQGNSTLQDLEYQQANLKQTQRLSDLSRDRQILQEENLIEQYTFEREMLQIEANVTKKTQGADASTGAFWQSAYNEHTAGGYSGNSKARLNNKFKEAFEPSVGVINNMQKEEIALIDKISAFKIDSQVETDPEKLAKLKAGMIKEITRYRASQSRRLQSLDPAMVDVAIDQGHMSLEELSAKGLTSTASALESLFSPEVSAINEETFIEDVAESTGIPAESFLPTSQQSADAVVVDPSEAPTEEDIVEASEGQTIEDLSSSLSDDSEVKVLSGLDKGEQIDFIRDNPETTHDLKNSEKVSLRIAIVSQNLELDKMAELATDPSDIQSISEMKAENLSLMETLKGRGTTPTSEDGPEPVLVISTPSPQEVSLFEAMGVPELTSLVTLSPSNGAEFKEALTKAVNRIDQLKNSGQISEGLSELAEGYLNRVANQYDTFREENEVEFRLNEVLADLGIAPSTESDSVSSFREGF